MGAKTEIAWTDATWNPLRGCSRVSEGCRNCYAETVAARFSGPGQPYEGLATRSPGRWTGEVRLVEEHLTDPLRWKKPKRIFVNSMSDLFHERVPDEWIDRIFAVMALAPQHTFQVLTKRPERMREYLREGFARYAEVLSAARILRMDRPKLGAIGISNPTTAIGLRNIWLGVSVEDQKTAEERIPILLKTPAAVRFVSYEPALGPVNFTDLYVRDEVTLDALRGTESATVQHVAVRPWAAPARLSWLIVGDESGPCARPFDAAWSRTTIKACKAAGVACFVKQMGAKPVWSGAGYRERMVPMYDASGEAMDDGGSYLSIRDRKGADPSEWPEDLRVQEFPKEAP